MEEAQIVVDVETSPLSESMHCKLKLQKRKMQPKLDKLWGNPNEANFTIFRTPHNISQTKKNLFEPSVISIGPYHRGQKHLQALEEQKWRFLQDFLSRGEHVSLDLCVSEMNSLEERTRRCYSEMFDDLDSDTFVEMMLLDGCFVLEYFLKKFEPNSKPIFEVGWNSNFILRDLLLLENQIPFFIVEKLYEIGLNKQEIIKNFVRPLVRNVAHLLVNVPMIADQPPSEIHHLVHLCYYYLVPAPVKAVVLSSKSFDLNRIIKVLPHWFCSRVLKGRSPRSASGSSSVTFPDSTGNISSRVIPSATDLKQKGLKFTPKSDPNDILDISFEYGVLKIPRLAITDSTKPIFANLIAFEQSKYRKKNSPFTSFLIFLDNLVNTENDVRILQECRIIENWLGTEEHVAHFLNHVTEGTIFESDHYLAELFIEVNRHIESRWNRYLAKLIRDYFSSPWAIMSVVAAFIFLVLTFVQSFFAIYAYKVPPSS